MLIIKKYIFLLAAVCFLIAISSFYYLWAKETLKNTGSAHLNIKKVKARRGCAVADYNKAISPGQEGKVTLQIDTKNKNHGKVRLKTNSEKMSTLSIVVIGK